MSANVPATAPAPAAPGGGFLQNSTCRWTVHVNLAFLVGTLVILYVVHSWKRMKELEEKRRGSR
jgi:hypothetical protein